MWILFNIAIIGLLVFDLCYLNRRLTAMTLKEALLACSFWVGLSLLFNIGIYFTRGWEDALSFLTGYLIEYTLSIDNLFVFLLIFQYFQVPREYMHKVLFLGILGAIVMRACFILIGVFLVQKYSWILYVFGGFLIVGGIKLALEKDKEIHPEKNWVIVLFRKFFPVSNTYEGGKFFVKKNGKYLATPLFLVLLAIETTDVIFAMDSIPAIFAITLDPFIVYTSNIFAVLGLRSLYFALSGMMELFHHLHYGLAAILIFVGTKMLLHDVIQIPTGISLLVIFLILAASVVASAIDPKTR